MCGKVRNNKKEYIHECLQYYVAKPDKDCDKADVEKIVKKLKQFELQNKSAC